ncbi:hypothetical protein [Lyngbya aestuarii]|uniref:hypothetical protein n=1 Tax=Lyngbya aestuarii TaxID=118322 RepID=UPI00403D9CFB
MTQLTNHHSPRRGRLFPEQDPSPEEKAKLKAAQELLHKQGKLIFEKVRPQLIDEHYNWFIIIEPDSGDYFIDQNQITALKRTREKYPDKLFAAFRLNETGVCGRI